MTNDYSAQWFARFLRRIDRAQTTREVAFLARQLPRPPYARVLDLCCGEGRHAHALAQQCYDVTGVDRDGSAIAAALADDGPTPTFIRDDMRNVARLPGTYDAAIIMWQSFGFFDTETNINILRQLHSKLAPHGRLILDVYHREFFDEHQGTRTFDQNGHTVVERRLMLGERLVVELDYGPGLGSDRFEWQLFTPGDLTQIAMKAGFARLVACSNFDERSDATATVPRMQLVLEKR